jgi:hypothetical protein
MSVAAARDATGSAPGDREMDGRAAPSGWPTTSGTAVRATSAKSSARAVWTVIVST